MRIFWILCLAIPLFGQSGNSARYQPQLNPEISLLGDLWTTYDDRENETRTEVHELEINIAAPLDPYTNMKVFLGIENEEEDYHVDVEEAYIYYTGLPGNFRLDLGKFHQAFGEYNRWHRHALPIAEYPLPLQALLGEEGMIGTGLSLSNTFSSPMAHAHTLTLQATQGKESEDRLLGRFLSYWDLSPTTYAQVGFSYAHQDPHPLVGMDFSFVWEKPGLQRDRSFTLRGEYIEEKDTQKKGAFLLGEMQLTRRWSLGAGYQTLENVEDRVNLFLTLWQSEFVRLRLQGDYILPDVGENTYLVLFQLTFAAGPHKHEKY